MLHAVGAAEAGVIYSRVREIPDRDARFKADEIAYVSLGDGATSEGEFWEALNVACAKRLPVLFLVELPPEGLDVRQRRLRPGCRRVVHRGIVHGG